MHYRTLMAEFNIQVSVEGEDTAPERVADTLSSVVEANEGVQFGDSEDDDHQWLLEIEDVETYADIYTDLTDSEYQLDIELWGPTADRFPIPIQHYALQQLSTPDAYEFYALDNKVTLVIADSERHIQMIESEVPPPALG